MTVGAGGPVVDVVGGEVVGDVGGGAVSRDDSGVGAAAIGAVVGDGDTLVVVDVVIPAGVAGGGTTAAVEAVVLGSVAQGLVTGVVLPELTFPCLSPECVIGLAISTTHKARMPTRAAAPPSSGARHPGLASTAATSRAGRP